jgi:hypothetical protein
VQAHEGISKVWIYNLAGFKVREQNGNAATQLMVDVKGLPAGYYIVTVMSGREMLSLKLIKQ